MLQLANTLSSHMPSLLRFSFFLNKFQKNGVKSKNSSSKWNRSQVTISNLQPDFPFFFNEFQRNGINSANSSTSGLHAKFPYAIFTPIFHLISEFEKNGVNSEHSCYKGIIPEVPICYLYLDFPFFFSEFDKTSNSSASG